MSKTYLQIVNKVLVNLREASRASVATDVYSTLIGEYVNVAKETIEDSWTWRALTSEIRFVTVDHQVQYFLDAAATSPAVTLTSGNYPDDRASILKDDADNEQVFDITQVAANVIYNLTSYSRGKQVQDGFVAASRSTTTPYKFAYTMEGGRPAMYLADPPPVGRTVSVRMCCPQPELTSDSTAVLVPYRPIVSFATFLAMQERGEELGTSADLYLARYNSELVRAQELDRDGYYEQLLVDTQ